MQQLIRFLQKHHIFLVYLFLLAVAVMLTLQSHLYHKSQFINSANALTGNLYKSVNNFKEYLYLKEDNRRLAEENSRLRNLLLAGNSLAADSLQFFEADSTLQAAYKFIPAKVINNNYALNNNYLVLNAGKKAGVRQEMGVASPEGIVGIVNRVSEGYATVLSILNSHSSINARLKKSNHFGSLVWNRKSPQVVQLIDIPRVAPVEVGDTIVTGGKSAIFPDGINIGVIREVTLNEHSNYFVLDVQLFTDMTNLGYVYVIENLNKEEIKALEAKQDE